VTKEAHHAYRSARGAIERKDRNRGPGGIAHGHEMQWTVAPEVSPPRRAPLEGREHVVAAGGEHTPIGFECAERPHARTVTRATNHLHRTGDELKSTNLIDLLVFGANVNSPRALLPVAVDDLAPLPARRLRALALAAIEPARRARLAFPPPAGRTFVRLDHTDAYDLWLIRWSPGASTSLHDHGGSAGAFCVVEGRLEERTPRSIYVLDAAEHRVMPSAHIHEVHNPSRHMVATSVHVYSPPLSGMRHYDAGLRVVGESLV
jgi:Cysteine dioxygenase type I